VPPAEPTVCHITSVHVPTDSRILFHECRSLASRYRTLLLCRDDEGSRTLEGVEIIALPRPKGRFARFAGRKEMVTAARDTGASLFHFHDPELLPVMADLQRISDKPVIYDVHEHYPDAMDQKAWIPAPLRPAAGRWADRLERDHAPAFQAIVVADAALRERFEAFHRRVVQLDNYPPLALFPAPRSIPSGPPTLVYVGSVSKVRGFYQMAEVIERVRERIPDARLLIYGRPTEEVARDLPRFLETLPPGAVEMRGPISYGDIGQALHDAWVGLSLLQPHPKYEKNVSMKVFDYMAAGLPYVASGFAPLRDATGGVGGSLVTPGSVGEAASAVLGLLENAESRDLAGREGRDLVEKSLNWESREPSLFGLYEDLLG
jgi:glycosyltransferase involved in cell wall biosynthesis